MFVVQLKFSANKSQAAQWMDGHKAWIKRGFDEGVLLLVGSLQPNVGGGILAHQLTRDELQARLNDDPFVAHDVVSVEIIEITPAQADDRLKFLLG